MKSKKLSLIKNVLIFTFFLSVAAALVHAYVVYPLYIKKIPYFSQAIWNASQVSCNDEAPSNLKGIFRYVSLPFFALEGELVLIDQAGNISECHVPGDLTEGRSYRLASLSKVLTSFVILDLLEKQEVSLEDALLDYFPEVDVSEVRDPNVLEVSLQHLLNHSSGFGGPFGSDNMVKKGESPWCPYDPSALEKVRLAGQPGSRHLYTNVAYCLLGEIITRVTGQPYQEYVQSNYLSSYPSLGFVSREYLPTEPVYDYSNDYMLGEGYRDWLDFDAIAPAAGLIGKPTEFAQLIWNLNQRHPDVLRGASAEKCEQTGLGYCYSNTFVVHEAGENERIGVQQGYLPGSSSLVAVTTTGEVLVWVAPGAPLESRYRTVLENRVVSILRGRVGS